jgi:hypothetical protein
MRKVGIIFLLLAGSLWAYENAAMPDMSTPSELKAGQAEFILNHRFRGLVDEQPIDNLFGMHGGANVGLGFRVSAGKGLDITLSHVLDSRESSLNLGYSFSVPNLLLRAKLEARLFSFRPLQYLETRKTSELFDLAIQTQPLAGSLSPVVNVFYDGFTKKWRFAAGCDVLLTGKFHVFGEYYPQTENTILKNCFEFGFKVLTWGHQFYFLLGNGSEPFQYMPGIGNRSLAMGSVSNKLHFGFSIHRFLEF